MAERFSDNLPDFLNPGGVQLRNDWDISAGYVEESKKELKSKLARDRAANPRRFGLKGGRRLLGTDVSVEDLQNNESEILPTRIEYSQPTGDRD